ncbi:heme ABC exporter ATP-binding protein CcmA [Phenylobacterium montanum]|uniref:Heme ABC exporter ATP-binding protein CcmA n=1 Tax=Phenylobacterium montanum TaxID=2823693 RepID=A0A975FX01_9CAUL|nr:heme ABC exporter ATP-binding protein CcmA [Caulobacter sp. S6]QUD87028.1 heme ABC exporter ATP-binding protein CcmA [Caulobacter sp. S6]
MITAVSVTDLALTRGDRLLFEGFGLNLAAGEAVALTGRNGAGKTSLLRAIAGLIRPQAGSIAFSCPHGALDSEEARSRDLHYLGHQDGLKTGRTAWDELVFQARWTGGSLASAEAACERLELNRLKDLEVRKLSAGQRRRVALARLLASPRRLWLLDEPLAPLDADRRTSVGEIMREHLASGGLILAAVHDPLPISARGAEIGA